MSATGISLMHAGPNREEVLRHGSTTAPADARCWPMAGRGPSPLPDAMDDSRIQSEGSQHAMVVVWEMGAQRDVAEMSRMAPAHHTAPAHHI
jgi:hypothetical protein